MSFITVLSFFYFNEALWVFPLFTMNALFHKHIFLKASKMTNFKRVRLILSVDVLKISFWLRLQILNLCTCNKWWSYHRRCHLTEILTAIGYEFGFSSTEVEDGSQNINKAFVSETFEIRSVWQWQNIISANGRN